MKMEFTIKLMWRVKFVAKTLLWYNLFFLALSKVEVDSVKRVNEVDTLPVDKGENLTLTCRSDLASLTLEFGAVVYNDTKNENGTYTVTYTKEAEKGDNNQTVLCKATNSTGFKFEASATVLLKGTNLYIS